MSTSPQPALKASIPQLVPQPKWVISDTHFGHENILAYCPWRPTWAQTIAEHDAAIIAAWQACVGPDDWILHLGDFCLGEKGNIAAVRAQLPGRIILLRGNHDRSATFMRAAGFDLVHTAIRIEQGNYHWIGRHNPAAFTIGEAAHATRLLHGHCHGNGYADDTSPTVRAKAVDCSLDAVRSIGPVPWTAVCGECP